MNTTIVVAALQTPQAIALANEGAQVRLACERVRDMTIPDQLALDALSAGLVEVKHRRQFLEDERKSRTKPLLDQVALIRAEYAPVESAYEDLDKAMRERRARHEAETNEARQAAQLAAGAAFQAGDNAGAYQALVAAPPPAESAGATVGSEWAFEITNEGMVPREYCTPVPKLIRATFKPGQKDAPDAIPGVRFFQRAKVRVTG